MDEYTGRVNISDYSGGVPFELHQNMGVNQNAGFTDALKNIHSDNELSNLFFSRVNIDFLQQKIIDEVANYFLAQRIALEADNYEEKIELLHHIIVYAMKSKQSAESEPPQILFTKLSTLKELYLSHGRKH